MKVLKIIGIVILCLIFLGVIYYYNSVGFTKKQKYYNCVEKCRELLIIESNKQFCPMRCEEVSGYKPSAKETFEAEERAKAKEETKKEEEVKSQESTVQKTNPIPKQETKPEPEPTLEPTPEPEPKQIEPVEIKKIISNKTEREYYCKWVWPQKIIDRNTKEFIVSCPSSHPWCYYADFKYENVGCCREDTHESCIPLNELID